MDRVTPGEASGMGVPGSDLPMTLEESQWAPSEFVFVTLSNGGQRHSHGVSVDYFWKGMWGPWDCSSIEKIVFFFFSLKKKMAKRKTFKKSGHRQSTHKNTGMIAKQSIPTGFHHPMRHCGDIHGAVGGIYSGRPRQWTPAIMTSLKDQGEAPDRARQLQKSFCPPLALSQAET